MKSTRYRFGEDDEGEGDGADEQPDDIRIRQPRW